MGSTRRVLESARRGYGELIRGRTRVRVVPERLDHPTVPPRFLLSPYRSGTTLFRYCLDSHPDLAVPPESDFLAPLLSVLDDVPSMTGLRDLGYAEEDVVDKLARFGRSFHDVYASSRGAGGGWLDKSPRYAEDPELLVRAYPDARFVVLHRHPLDQIHSFTKGGVHNHPALGDTAPGRPRIEAAARYWAEVTRGIVSFSERHADQTLVITYEDMCRRPEETFRAVLSHLDLPWSPNVLSYHKFDHDLGREAGRVAGTRGFDISTGTWTRWEPGWVDAAWALVEPVARGLGYDKAPA